MPGKLEGKVAIVTGGSDGIGAETCRLFAREGARVAIVARGESKGLAVQEEIRGEGGDATFIRCDVTDSAAVNAAVDETVSTYGGVNVLMNNAGRSFGGRFPDEEDDTFDATVRLNLHGTFYMSRAVWGPHLVEAGGGAIVNVSSVAAVIAHNKRSFDAGGAIGPPAAYAGRQGRRRGLHPLHRGQGRTSQHPDQLHSPRSDPGPVHGRRSPHQAVLRHAPAPERNGPARRCGEPRALPRIG